MNLNYKRTFCAMETNTIYISHIHRLKQNFHFKTSNIRIKHLFEPGVCCNIEFYYLNCKKYLAHYFVFDTTYGLSNVK